jgi:hypothetical protein
MTAWRDRVNWQRVPVHMREGVALYVERGIPQGDFLSALISNDLKLCCAYADVTNRTAIWDIVSFFYAYAPAGCWGSKARMEEWIANKGLEGQQHAVDA